MIRNLSSHFHGNQTDSEPSSNGSVNDVDPASDLSSVCVVDPPCKDANAAVVGDQKDADAPEDSSSGEPGRRFRKPEKDFVVATDASGITFPPEPVLPCHKNMNLLPTNWRQRWFRSLVLKQASKLIGGVLVFIDADGKHSVDDSSAENRDRHAIELTVADGAAYQMIATGGELGFADALVQGKIGCQKLAALVRLLTANIATSDQIGRSVWNWRSWFAKLQHRLRRNSLKNSKRNISAHYDLSNDFFQLWLDSTMSYSSAVFPDLQQRRHCPEAFARDRSSMQKASEEKLRRICEKLELTADDHLLEIGCGWGGLAIYAAENYGCRVTGVTLSEEQLKYANEQIAARGLEDRIDLRLQDYRHLNGQFDKLVSIEMIEAVGHQYLDQYFQQCCRLLKPAGRMVLQAITIAEHRYESYLRNADFIRQYIFPGGSLPCVGAIMSSISRTGDFRPTHLEDIGLDYAETLRHWRWSFHQQLKSIEEMGFDPAFQRTWDYYLAYCEGAFDQKHIGTVQLVLDRPGCDYVAALATNRLSTSSELNVKPTGMRCNQNKRVATND